MDNDNPIPHQNPSFAVGSEESKVQYGKADFTKSQIHRFYANHVAANVTLFDIRLLLSDVDIAGNEVSAVQTVMVLMSPELATLAHSLLGKALDTYTKAYGRLRVGGDAIKQAEQNQEPPA
jgi:hypothetical protein